MWMCWPWGVWSAGSLQRSLGGSHPSSVLWKITGRFCRLPFWDCTGRGWAEHHLMWHSSFSMGGKMCLQTLHCAELQDRLNPETRIPVHYSSIWCVLTFVLGSFIKLISHCFLMQCKEPSCRFCFNHWWGCCVIFHPWAIFRCPCTGPGWVLVLLSWMCKEPFASSHASSFASLNCCIECFVCPKAPL